MIVENTGHSGKRWFAAYTRRGKEIDVERRFDEQGFECFLPKIEKSVIRNRHPEPTEVAFFPSYIFVTFDPKRDCWHPINRTYGMNWLIMQGERPVPVPRGMIEQLQAMTDEKGILRFGGDLEVGDKVRIMNGPFADMIGRVARLDGKHRVQVLIEMMLHGHIPMSVPRGSIARTE